MEQGHLLNAESWSPIASDRNRLVWKQWQASQETFSRSDRFSSYEISQIAKVLVG